MTAEVPIHHYTGNTLFGKIWLKVTEFDADAIVVFYFHFFISFFF